METLDEKQVKELFRRCERNMKTTTELGEADVLKVCLQDLKLEGRINIQQWLSMGKLLMQNTSNESYVPELLDKIIPEEFLL